jgi:hypothetical protein
LEKPTASIFRAEELGKEKWEQRTGGRAMSKPVGTSGLEKGSWECL